MITLNWPRNLQTITFIRCLLVCLYVSLSVFSACYPKLSFLTFAKPLFPTVRPYATSLSILLE